MLELPEFSALAITQVTAKPAKRHYEALDQLTIILPKAPTDAVFRRLPQGAQLAALHARAKLADAAALPVSTRLDNARATRITAGVLAGSDAFALLDAARKLVAKSLEEQPARIGVLAAGDGPERERALLAFLAAIEAAAFELPAFKSGKLKRRRLRSVQVIGALPRNEMAQMRAAARGNNIARWFTALPPNKLTARTYREAAAALAKAHSMQAEFLNEAALEKLGAGAFLAVTQGNDTRDAGILRLKYRPSRNARPELALVGKGIIFDTGGTNLKTFKSMLDMHIDMGGSAVALGIAVALADLEVPYAFDVWMAITENRLSPRAYKSQDVVEASNGTTIQVIHTDAEGRMVLADTLALAAREQPSLIIDYATLTGSCISALTDRYSGVFANRSDAHAVLVENGIASGERVWPFPLDDDFDRDLVSDVADVKQCSADGSGDHILAARFLRRFVPQSIPWIHMDLSAAQRKEGLAHVPTEITGFGVRYTLELLRRHASPAELAARFAA